LPSLISGCGRLTYSVKPAGVVAGSGENILTLEQAPAPEPTFTPNPTTEPSETVPALPDTINTDCSVINRALSVDVYDAYLVGIVAVVVCGWALYRYVRPKIEDIEPVPPLSGLETVELTLQQTFSQGYKPCYFYLGYKNIPLLSLGIFLKK
jgi:hypothetical protein